MTELAATRADDGTWVFDVVTAAASIPVRPPKAWFEDPGLSEATALTVEPSGRVYGHACAWQSRHIGLPGAQHPPKTRSGYREYLNGQVETDDGAMVATGRITLGGGHAGLGGDLVAAQQHYDDVSWAVADVQCGEDAVGLWFAGALRPEVTPEQIRALRASSVSGDWRSVDGNLALCAVHAVNVPGFCTPRAQIAASGSPIALVAAGMVPRSDAPSTPQEPPMSDPTDATTPDSMVAASPIAKGEPAPDAPPADATDGGFAKGDAISLDDVDPGDLIGQVSDVLEDGRVVVEIAVPAEAVQHADEAVAASAAARFSDRMADRARDRDIVDLKRTASSLADSNASLLAAVEASNATVDKLLTQQRNAEFDRIVASAGIDEAGQ